MINVKYVVLDNNAVEPKFARIGDAGADLTATSKEINGNIITYGTGIAMSIPRGHVGLLFPRSSVYKKDISMANSVGVIDSGYRGEIMLKYRFNKDTISNTYTIGDRIGQIVIVPIPEVELEKVDQLSSSERGEGGFGSTGI